MAGVSIMSVFVWIIVFLLGSLFWCWILFWGGAEFLQGSYLTEFLFSSFCVALVGGGHQTIRGPGLVHSVDLVHHRGLRAGGPELLDVLRQPAFMGGSQILWG